MAMTIRNSRSSEEILREIIEEGQELQKAIEDRPRVRALNYDALFDQSLKLMLTTYFSKRDKAAQKLFDPSIGGPLASLTHKARLAYALGIIDKTALDDLLQLHKVRNIFAHSVDSSFSDTEVWKECQKLSTTRGRKVTGKDSLECYERSVGTIVKYITQKLQQER